MEYDVWIWVAFGAFVVAMLCIDLFAFGGSKDGISMSRAVGWTIGWTVLGLAFALVMWALQGPTAAGEYLSGFLIEKSLSIDNLFVFAMIFSYLATPALLQRRVIFWGIVGAMVFRGVFILVGATLIDAFHATMYLFGAILIVTGVRMFRHSEVSVDPAGNPALRLLHRVMPMSDGYSGDRFTVREAGKRMATPLLAALVLVATFDLVFAVDSIPAIFAVTRETFIVYAANAFSLLGLGAMFFVLAGMIGRFRYLNVGLAAVLIFVGVKMALVDVVHISPVVSLAVIVTALTAAIGASYWRERSEPQSTATGGA